MTIVKKYAPNSVRWETDGDIAYRTIYINDEFVEMCPLQATKEEAEMRLHELMDEMWIEGNDEPIYQNLD